MALFLAIQNTYTTLEIGLFKHQQCLQRVTIDKIQASKECILSVQHILDAQKLSLADLSFIAANQGPGPFTTLRVAITMINGISFATGLPLIGINSLEALLQEYAHEPQPVKVALLNAFGQDLYYGIAIPGKEYHFGCTSIPLVIQEIQKKTSNQDILFLGNGIHLCQPELQNIFAHRAQFLAPNPQTVSLEQVARMAATRWDQQKAGSPELQPLYYKPAFIHQ